MSLKRYIAASFFSLTLAASGFAYVTPTLAEDDTDSDPVLHEAEAKNTGGTTAKEAGDSIVIEFSETTNKYAITASNIGDEFELSSDHSFLDGVDSLGGATWSDDGEELTIVLSAGTSLPTVAVGDTITYVGDNIKDLDGNVVEGSAEIEGSFTAEVEEEECEDDSDEDEDENEEDEDEDENEDEDEDEDEDELSTSVSGSSNNKNKTSKSDISDDDDDAKDEAEDCDDDSSSDTGKYRCGTGLQNGRLYKVKSEPTVYLLAACRFKPFRGIAAFNSRGLKFQDVVELDALPSNLKVSDKPAVPAEGTLVKGSDATVYFIAKNGKRKGFTSAQVFLGLGFKFEEVDQISDSDLSTIEADTELVNDGAHHPDGALIKCGNSGTVFKVIDNLRFPFANAEAFQTRGHSYDKILAVDCGRFAYKEAPAIVE